MYLLLVAMPFVTSSFLLLVVRPGAPSSVLATSSDALRYQEYMRGVSSVVCERRDCRLSKGLLQRVVSWRFVNTTLLVCVESKMVCERWLAYKDVAFKRWHVSELLPLRRSRVTAGEWTSRYGRWVMIVVLARGVTKIIDFIGGGVNRIDISIFGPEQAIQANPFASQSKLKLALTRLPFVKNCQESKACPIGRYVIPHVFWSCTQQRL